MCHVETLRHTSNDIPKRTQPLPPTNCNVLPQLNEQIRNLSSTLISAAFAMREGCPRDSMHPCFLGFMEERATDKQRFVKEGLSERLLILLY